MPEWNIYAVQREGGFYPSTDRGLTEFDVVGHTSHVDSAINIILEGGIKPALVFDKSQLNESRIQVGWLSPNHWVRGYRYGNIQFEFKFDDLIYGKNFYWVEAIDDYTPSACRILITDQDRSAQLVEYDPTLRDGPWWHDKDNNTHFYNGKFCLEFMFEEKIPLTLLSGFRFVDHHAQFCSVHRYSQHRCDQLGDNAAIGGAKFLLKASARAVDLSDVSGYFFYQPDKFDSDFQLAVSKIPRLITVHDNYGGPITIRSRNRMGLARATLNAIVCDRLQEASEILNLFDEEETFVTSLAEVILDTVGSGPIAPIINALS
ncbi:hypothetical protein GTP45_11720 [Pseudoduganella sp. FT55W]|uniref:Uncharacterized protein n=1 Tax=Duganella rivi TaxID=2666083 RepID=A0A7X4GQ17_9BURK|nr:hypothetical protein [Duganella rivi]MYM67496.1 hypothetical protein [Duganella rivi]